MFRPYSAFWDNLGLWIGAVCLALAGLLIGTGLGLTAGVWPHHSTAIQSPFYTAWTHHRHCGTEPSGPITRGVYGAYHQRFPHCSMTFSRVFVIHDGTPTATPRPTRTPLPPAPAPPPPESATPRPSPTQTAVVLPTPAATPTPWIIFVPAPTATALPAPLPTATPATPPPADPVAYDLSLLNATRAQYGAEPLTLNPTQSAGTAACVGSLGHSVAMAQSGSIWHINPAYPAASFPTSICVLLYPIGENVGEGSAFGDPRPMLAQLHASMMAEGTGNCATVTSHACNIINPAFQQIGIGITVQNGAVWLTQDFLG